MPVDYRALLPFSLTPAMWAQKGSIPGLVTLLRAFFARDAAAVVESNQHTSVLGIVQPRLVPSRANDGWGFELLQSVELHVSLYVFRILTTGEDLEDTGYVFCDNRTPAVA
jgi:exportin-2 (importin alpha re-exporter)